MLVLSSIEAYNFNITFSHYKLIFNSFCAHLRYFCFELCATSLPECKLIPPSRDRRSLTVINRDNIRPFEDNRSNEMDALSRKRI